jgi:hypothetical protein
MACRDISFANSATRPSMPNYWTTCFDQFMTVNSNNAGGFKYSFTLETIHFHPLPAVHRPAV